MNLALIGSTGFVGSKVLKEALSRGHQVTAISRDPSKITTSGNGLTPLPVDIFNPQALSAALAGHDAVISAYNSGWSNPNLYQDFKRGYASILSAAKEAKVPRLLVVGGASSLVLPDGRRVFDVYIPEDFKRAVIGAMELLDDLKKEQELNWVFLSPPIDLTDGDRTGAYRIGTDAPVTDAQGKSAITTGDLASVILDEIENPRFIRQRFTAGY